MAHLWSGRFDSDPDAELLRWGASFSFDRRLFPDDVTGSLAWAEVLTKAGVLAEEESRAITSALQDLLAFGPGELRLERARPSESVAHVLRAGGRDGADDLVRIRI